MVVVEVAVAHRPVEGAVQVEEEEQGLRVYQVAAVGLGPQEAEGLQEVGADLHLGQWLFGSP